MVIFNPTKREIGAKIVYYGPALCGKTTNIQFVHKKMNPNQRGELVSLATKDDRTLFFDFLPLELGKVKGFTTRFHLYTVPGQVYYVSTRRAVLTGVDGIVFVADSQDEKMAENIESLEDLERNLLYYGKKMEDIPMVMQYNKCDLENLSSIGDLNSKLNKRNLPYTRSSAVTGKGVMETLTIVCKIVLQNLEDGAKKPKPAFKERPSAFAPTPPPPVSKPAPPKPSPFPPSRPADQLIELEPEEEVSEIERLRAERRATIDRLLKPEPESPAEVALKGKPEPQVEEPEEIEEIEEQEEIAQEPVELKSPEETEGVSVDATLELGGIEKEDLEKEAFVPEVELPEEPLEFEEIEEEAQPEAEEGVLEMERPKEELELGAEEEVRLEEAEKAEVPPDQFKPELMERPSEPELLEEKLILAPEAALKVSAIEIMSFEEPQKVSPSSIKLPLTIKLTDSNQEAKITLVIQVEEFIK